MTLLAERASLRSTAVPVSAAQLRIWLFGQMEPESPAYHIVRVTRWLGPLEPGLLAASLSDIVRRHTMLRSRFVLTEDGVAQEVTADVAVPIPVEDLTELPHETRADEVRRRVRLAGRRPFDLSEGPLLHATLLRLGPTEHLLVLVIHHIAADNWSARLVLSELTAVYSALSAGQPSPFAPPAIEYRDYARWQLSRLQSEPVQRERAYWRNQLRGAPRVLELPTDHPRPPVQGYEGARYSFGIDPVLIDRLTAVSRRQRVTLFMTLLAALQTLLWRYTGQSDLVVGTPVAGRTRLEFENLVGCFTNTLILRGDLSGDPLFSELLRRVRAMTLGAYAHQELPFESIVAELSPERTTRYHPLFQILFNFRDFPPLRLQVPGLQLEPVPTFLDTTFLDLAVELDRTIEGFTCSMTYSVRLFEAATIERLAMHYRMLLEAIAENPDARLSVLAPPEDSSAETELLLAELEGLPEAEARRLLTQEMGEDAR